MKTFFNVEVEVTVRLNTDVVANAVAPSTAKLRVEVAPVERLVVNVLFSTHPLPFQ